MQSFQVLIRLDAGRHVGLGHLRRCLVLARALHRQKVQAVGFLTRTPLFVRKWVGPQFPVVPLHSKKLREEILECRWLFSVQPPALYIIDQYEYTPGHVEALRDVAPQIAYVDDMARWDRFPVDAVINHNIHAFQLPYPKKGLKLFLGTSYSLVSEDIAAFHNRRKTSSAPRLFITLGGAAKSEEFKTVLKAFEIVRKKIKNAQAYLAAGIRPINKMVPQAGTGIRLVPSHKFAQAMSRCNLAVSASGVTSYELACLGIPAVLLIAADNQKGICKEMARRRCAVQGGWISKLNPSHLAGQILNLWQNPAKRREMSKIGRRMVGTDGPLRLAQALKRSFSL